MNYVLIHQGFLARLGTSIYRLKPVPQVFGFPSSDGPYKDITKLIVFKKIILLSAVF